MDFFVLCNLLVCRFFIGRVFPAPAGMNPVDIVLTSDGIRVPRTRGDEPDYAINVMRYVVCSPHPRG